jgi:hypothetical protein
MGRIFTSTLSSVFGFWLVTVLAACQFSIDAPVLPYQALQVESIIAYGDGYMAGYTNSTRRNEEIHGIGGLYEEGQMTSVPKLVVDQYNALRQNHDFQPILFRQPLAWGEGSGRLTVDKLATPGCSFLPSYAITHHEIAHSRWEEPLSGPFHNFSVPHLKTSQIKQADLGYNNPFYHRVHPDSTLSYLELIRKQDADLFLLWIGTNDLLEHALSGANAQEFAMTEVALFAELYREILQTQFNLGRKGLVATIPDVTLFPYFQTVPRNYLHFQNCFANPKPVFIEAKVDSATIVRAATQDDLLLLPSQNLINQGNNGYGLSESSPVPDRLVLDEGEVAQIRERTKQYNDVIMNLLEEFNSQSDESTLSLVRLDLTFDQLREGEFETGVYLDSKHLTGGVFNLDGLYLTPRGNALIANHFIREINRFPAFKATMPVLNLREFSGVLFP